MLLYEEILQGCEEYHECDEYGYDDDAYDAFMRDKNRYKWDNPHMLNHAEVNRLVDFLNDWRIRMPDDRNNITHLLTNLKSEVRYLHRIIPRSATLLDVNFDETTKQTIAECFDGIAQTRRYESVGTSMVLHVAINPQLFVMWNGPIRSYYGLINENGSEYAHEFLPWMQEIANRAVDEVMDQENLPRAEASQSFTERCEKKNTLAKIIDEYNFAKFTKGWL